MELAEVAKLEEFRLARANEELCDECLHIGGGIAGRGAPGSWLNLAVAIGLRGPVSRADFERMIRWYEDAGIEPRMEVCPYADPGFLKDCEQLGFRLRTFETIFYRPLSSRERVQPLHPLPPGLHIEILDTSDAAAVRQCALVALRGFLPPGGVITDEDIEIFQRGTRHPRTVTFTARLEGEIVAVGACEIDGAVSALFGMATSETHRRRGIQQALLAARLNLAAARSARVATIGSRPGVATERNVMRMGFTVAYTKVVLIRPGEGLVPMRF
jgi:GNAT superfamily N-acetyltransferase